MQQIAPRELQVAGCQLCHQPGHPRAVPAAQPARLGRAGWAPQGCPRVRGMLGPWPGSALTGVTGEPGIELGSTGSPTPPARTLAQQPAALPCPAQPHEHQGTFHSSTFVLTVSYPRLFLGPLTPLTKASGGQTTASTAMISQTRTQQETNRSRLRQVFLLPTVWQAEKGKAPNNRGNGHNSWPPSPVLRVAFRKLMG